MASNYNSSPSEDISSGTDLSNIHTEDEETSKYNRLDTIKTKEIIAHGGIL